MTDTTDQLLAQILAAMQAPPSSPPRAYGFQKRTIAAGASATFAFDFVPDYFAVFLQYSSGNLTVLYREGAYVAVNAIDSDVIPLLDGLFLKVPARDDKFTLTNTSGSSVTALAWALGPDTDVLISQAK